LTWQNTWPAVSLVVNALMVLGIYSLRSTIRIAILEALQAIAREYATQKSVDQLRTEMLERTDLMKAIEGVRRAVSSRGATT
jgi:predicted hydrocarbon binding protein